MAKVTKRFQYGRHEVVLETGEIARQAGGAVMVSVDGTVVLVTAVAAKSAREGQDFFPLTVDYQEKFYAGGRIPGGFFKREGRPTEKETLICRLIDRPIRPLFPEEFKNEVQIIATLMSLNPEVEGDIPAMIGASAALALTGAPFQGPIGAAKVGYKNGQYILNPTATQLQTSQMNLVVAGTETAVLMVESEALELPEDVMLGGVVFGHTQMQAAITAINELVDVAGKPEWDWQAPAKDEALIARVTEIAGAKIEEAVDKALPSKFGYTVLTGAVLHPFFTYFPEAGPFCQYGNIAVHLPKNFNALHYFFTICFEAAVKIVQFDTGTPAGGGIE